MPGGYPRPARQTSAASLPPSVFALLERVGLGRLAADAGDDRSGDVAELEVAVLRRGTHDLERLSLRAPLPRHDHAEGLVDHRPRGQRGPKLLGELGI